MAETLNTTRRAVLSGLAAMPLTTAVTTAAPMPEISFAQAIAAMRDHLDAAVPEGHGWHMHLGANLDGSCYESLYEAGPNGWLRRIEEFDTETTA